MLGIHTNMPATVPADIAKALAVGGPPPAGLSADEKHAWDQLDFFYKNGLGYAHRDGEPAADAVRDRGFSRRPCGLDARPRHAQLPLIARVFDGKPEGLTRDDVLDNITLYWLTNTAISSARLYWDNDNLPPGLLRREGHRDPGRGERFPDEIYQAPKSWAERAYPKLIHYNRLDKGGHFAAWEQPELFVARDARRVPVAALDRDEPSAHRAHLSGPCREQLRCSNHINRIAAAFSAPQQRPGRRPARLDERRPAQQSKP